MKLISVVLLCFLVKGIANLPATSKPTTAQAYLNNAQQYINSVSNSNVQVPKVSTPIGNTVVNPPALPTVQTTKAPATTTKAPTTTTKAPTTTTKAPTTTTTTTTTTTPVPVTTTTKAPTTSEPVTTTKAPALTTETPITTKTPETITTKTPETTTVPSTSPTVSSTTTPCSTTTTTEIISTKTPETETTTVPSETDAPTSGTIVLSERLEEVLTQLLILLSEFVKTTNCVETSELLHQLIIQLSGELHIANTSENDESTTIESGGTSTTTSAEVIINPDQIRVIVIQIKDLIDQSNLNANNEEIYDVINQLIHILTEGSAVGGENTLDPPDHNGEIGTSNEKTNTSNEKTGNSDSENDTTTNVPCTSTPDVIPTKTPEITTISSETETSSPASAPCTTTTLSVTTETTTCEPTVHDAPTSGSIVLSERLEEVLTQLLILLSEFVKTTNCAETNELLHQLIIQLSGELHIANTSENDESTTIESGGTSTTISAEVVINPDQIRVIVIQIKDLIDQSNVNADNEEIYDVINQLIHILTEGSAVGGENTLDPPDHNGEIGTSNEKTDTSNEKTGTSADSESDTTTNVPCTSTPDIIPTKTPEITTISCETETSSPAPLTPAPCTTTTLPVTTETTTCEPTVHDDPTSGTIVLSERLEEVLTQLLILLSEFVKTTNCEETNELLHPLMIQLSDELHITSTFDSTSDGNEIESDNDDSTTINPDEIRVTLIQIKDIINQPNVTSEASEEICDVITQLISILTKESEVGVTSNVVSTDHNGDISKSNEQTDTPNEKTGTSNGQTDTSDSETGMFNEGTGISGEDMSNSEKSTSNEEAGTDNSNEGKITSNGEKDTSNTIDQPIQAELPIEGSNSNNIRNDLGPSDNDATLNSSQIDQLLSRLTDLITDANEFIDDVTGQLIPQLIKILTNWEDLFDGSNTIIGTIAGSEQIKDLINLLTTLLNPTNEIANIDAMNQIIKDLLNLLTVEGNDIEDVNGTNDKDGHNTATTTNSDSANGQISFEINEIVSQLEQLNNQPRTTTTNRKIDELIKQLEGQLIRTPTNNGPAWHEAVNQLISDIKKVHTQPINTKTNTQMRQLLTELVGKFTGVKNGNYPEDSIESLKTNYDDFMALLKQRQEQREARRKELAAIRAEQLAELAAQRKIRQQSYNDSMASLKKRQEQREAQRKELAAIRAQELADRAAERKMQQQSYNEPAYCVEDLTKSSDDFRASLKKRQEQREAQHKEFAAIRAQMIADQRKKTSQPNYGKNTERQTVPPTTKPNAPQTPPPTPVLTAPPTPLLTAPPTPLLTAPPTAKPTVSPTFGSSTSSNTTKKSNQLLSGLLSSLF